MSKSEKYWVFGMILMLSVSHKEVPTLLNSIGNVVAFIGGIICFLLMVWYAIRGEK